MIRRLPRFGVAALLSLALLGAGCGGDDEGGGDTTSAEETGETASGGRPGQEEEAALQEEIENLPDEEQVERVGEAWVEPFGKLDQTMCAYLHPDLGGYGTCVSADYFSGALTQSVDLQRSFAGTTVKDVDVKGQTAVADFGNGEQVQFEQDSNGDWKVVEPASGG